MTIGITGPKRRAPWQGAPRVLIVAAIIFLICLILLELISGFLVDWLWFSAIGYFGVFWTTIVAEAEVFFAVFLATAIILWVNGSLAFRFARSRWTQRPAEFEWKPTGVATLPEVLEFTRHRLPWPVVIICGACILAALVAWGEVNNWGVFLRFLYQVPYGASDPLYNNDISFYLFTLPAYVAIKNWMLLTLFLSALFAGAIYWVHGDIEYDAPAPVDVADSNRPRLGAAWLLLRGESVVLRSRPLSAALWRQRGGGRRELHRHPCGVARSLAADRPFDRCGIRRVGERQDAHLPNSRGSSGARLRRLLRVVRRDSSDYSSACSSNQASCNWRSPTSNATSR